MNIILLSGGSGKRLWPLSNDIRSKQFIKIFKTADGYESMVQRVYRQIKEVDADASVTIATSKTQALAMTIFFISSLLKILSLDGLLSNNLFSGRRKTRLECGFTAPLPRAWQ